MLPTRISDDFAVIERGIAAVRGAIAIGIPGILGIHIEGPLLNVEKKGIHDASKIRKMDERAVNLLSSLGLGKTLVTLAPETVAPDLIRSEEHTSALQSLMRSSYAVFCLKQKKRTYEDTNQYNNQSHCSNTA